MKLYLCKPYPRHLFEKFPKDFKHQIHKWTLGIILIDHIEPDGTMASENHKTMKKQKDKPQPQKADSDKGVEEFIEKYLTIERASLQFASVKYYAESGKISGHLYGQIVKMLNDFANQFASTGKESEWVSVEKEKPGKSVTCWVYTKSKSILIGSRFVFEENDPHNYYLIHATKGEIREDEVTHWMPYKLPEPPQKKES